MNAYISDMIRIYYVEGSDKLCSEEFDTFGNNMEFFLKD